MRVPTKRPGASPGHLSAGGVTRLPSEPGRANPLIILLPYGAFGSQNVVRYSRRAPRRVRHSPPIETRHTFATICLMAGANPAGSLGNQGMHPRKCSSRSIGLMAPTERRTRAGRGPYWGTSGPRNRPFPLWKPLAERAGFEPVAPRGEADRLRVKWWAWMGWKWANCPANCPAAAAHPASVVPCASHRPAVRRCGRPPASSAATAARNGTRRKRIARLGRPGDGHCLDQGDEDDAVRRRVERGSTRASTRALRARLVRIITGRS